MWFKSVGDKIIDQSAAGLDGLQAFRNTLEAAPENHWPWPPSDVADDLDESRLSDLIDILFIEQTRAHANIVNVYAKNINSSRLIDSSEVEDSGALTEQWVPTASARRTAKELMAELIPLC
jgi:hypothetical protein